MSDVDAVLANIESNLDAAYERPFALGKSPPRIGTGIVSG